MSKSVSILQFLKDSGQLREFEGHEWDYKIRTPDNIDDPCQLEIELLHEDESKNVVVIIDACIVSKVIRAN